MEAWIKSLIEFVAAPIRTLVAATVGRLATLWAVVTGFYAKVRNSLARWITIGQSWVASVRNHATQVYVTLRWLAVDYAPHLAANAFNQAVDWAGRELQTLRDQVTATASAILDWARRELNTIVDYLDQLVTWADAQVSAIINRLHRIEDHLFGVLATPERLAAWIVGAMAAALWRYLLGQAVPVGRELFRNLVPAALESADVAEDIIARII